MQRVGPGIRNSIKNVCFAWGRGPGCGGSPSKALRRGLRPCVATDQLFTMPIEAQSYRRSAPSASVALRPSPSKKCPADTLSMIPHSRLIRGANRGDWRPRSCLPWPGERTESILRRHDRASHLAFSRSRFDRGSWVFPRYILVGTKRSSRGVLLRIMSPARVRTARIHPPIECINRSGLMNRAVLISCPSHFPAMLSRRALAITESSAPRRINDRISVSSSVVPSIVSRGVVRYVR
jgi:hypothetical protein